MNDLVALKTISSYARLQTIAIDKKINDKRCFQINPEMCMDYFVREKTREGFFSFQAKIIKRNLKENDDVFAEFYLEFCHCHKAVSMMNFM